MNEAPLSAERRYGVRPPHRIFGLLPSLLTRNDDDADSPLGDLFDRGGMGTMNPGLQVENFVMRADGPDGGYLSFAVDLGIQLLPDESPDLEIIQTEISPINGRTYHVLEPHLGPMQRPWREPSEATWQPCSRADNRWILRTFGNAGRQNRDLDRTARCTT